MQPGLNSLMNSAQIAPLQDLQNGNHHPPPLPLQQQINDFDPAVATSTHDDFLDQMLSSLPSWNEFTTQNGHSKLAWEMKQDEADVEGNEANGVSPFCFDESAMLASKLRQNQISGLSSAERMMMLQQQLVMPRSEIGQNGVGDGSLFNSSNSGLESSIQGLYNGFAESLQSGQSQQFLQSQAQNFGAQATMSQAQGISSAGGAHYAILQPMGQFLTVSH